MVGNGWDAPNEAELYQYKPPLGNKYSKQKKSVENAISFFLYVSYHVCCTWLLLLKHISKKIKGGLERAKNSNRGRNTAAAAAAAFFPIYLL